MAGLGGGLLKVGQQQLVEVDGVGPGGSGTGGGCRGGGGQELILHVHVDLGRLGRLGLKYNSSVK